MSQIGKNAPSGEELKAFCERIESIRESKKGLSADETAIFAEAKAKGFNTPTIRALIKRRGMDRAKREEADALLDIYFHAVGLESENPLFRAAGLMSVDRSARDSVIGALKGAVPADGDIIIRAFGAPVRLWRDAEGEVHAEDWVEPPAAPAPGEATDPAPKPRPDAPPVPECTEDEAETLGEAAAREGRNVIENPFPAKDKRRPRWDKGWRRGNGGDGMGPADPPAPKPEAKAKPKTIRRGARR